MARPTDISEFGEAVYSQLKPVADLDEANNWALLNFVGAIAEMFKLMDQLAHSDPPWSRMIDPDLVPVEGLPWLGQLIGVTVNTQLSEADQRLQIKQKIGWTRGTVEAIKNAVKPYLTGTKTVMVRERDTSPYHFSIFTYSTETPPNKTYQDLYNSYATYQAFFVANATYETYWLTDVHEQIKVTIANNAKPAALQFTYSVLPGSPP